VSIRATESPSAEVFDEVADISAGYLARAKVNPEAATGIVRALITGTVGGRPLTEAEQFGVMSILFFGGLDTTRSAIGSIAYRVASNPGLEDRLRDPKWVRRDLDEFLRYDTPVACLARNVTTDTEVAGVKIKEGDRVLYRMDSANRDEARFTDADKLVFDTPRPGHAAFGLGVHRCIGSNMARVQLQVAFAELLKRVGNLRLVPGAEIQWAAGVGNAVRALPLEFDKRP
jgi:cytochrome P450